MSGLLYTLYRTNEAGEPLERPMHLDHHAVLTRIALECPRMSRRQIAHFLALAHAAPGHPVDVTHWEDGRMIYSARLERVAEREA